MIRLERILKSIKECGIDVKKVEPLTKEASAREYYRIYNERSDTFVLMLLPLEGEKHEEIGGYENPTQKPAFITMSEFFFKNSIPVPKVITYNKELAYIILEDLGDRRLFEEVCASDSIFDCKNYYKNCIRIIKKILVLCSNLTKEHSAYYRCFTEEVLYNELIHFHDYGFKELSGSKEYTKILMDFYKDLASRITGLRYGLVHRDFQSKNIMIDKNGNIRVLDFQDALLGPYVYDIVALLKDSYLDIPQEFVDEMLEFASNTFEQNKESLVRDFYLVAIQRKMKDAGRFVFIRDVKGNSSFMKYFKRTLQYILDSLRFFDEYRDIYNILRNLVEN